MAERSFRGWATPAAILAVGVAVCVTLAVGDAAARHQTEAVARAIERVETELVTARTPGMR